MDIARLPTISAYASTTLANAAAEPSERARIENLFIEERVSTDGLNLYAPYLDGSPVSGLDDWNSRHTNFTDDHIEIDVSDSLEPWTFRAENGANRLPLVDRRINLIRVEYAGWPCESNQVDFEQIRAHIAALTSADKGLREAAENFLTRFAKVWNAERDKRPSFATTELEVDDIFQGGETTWAEKLRDRLGLGQYSPAAGAATIHVFIMRYPLDEIYNAHAGQGEPAAPTLLDGKLNDFFFPSPMPGANADPNPCLGHSLNLSEVDQENDYKLGVELLHKRIDYKPEHFLHAGVIANPYRMPLERARRFHLPWLRLYRDRDDFGQGVMS